MNRRLPFAAPLALLALSWMQRGASPTSSEPERPLASLVPARCTLYVEGNGLGALLERGLDDPLVRTVLDTPLGRALLDEAGRTPAEALAAADEALGAPVLPLLRDLVQHGTGLGVAGAGEVVLVARGRSDEAVERALTTVLDHLERRFGVPGALDRPAERWDGADVWILGEQGFVVRRGALLVLGNGRSLVQETLALDDDPEGRGLLGTSAFAAPYATRSTGALLWAWADLQALEAVADAGFRELRAAERQPAFQSLLGAELAALASGRTLSIAIEPQGGDALALTVRGREARVDSVLRPRTRPGAVPAELADPALAEALLYRDYAALFAHRSELFPPETLPGFAEAVTNGALFFGGKDLGEEVLPALSPWLRVVVRALEFAPERKPEIPLPGLAVVAVVDDEESGAEWVSAFQTLIAVVNVDQAQKGERGLRLQLGREGEIEVSSARFPAPLPGDGVDARYNLEPALALVGRHLVLGTHESLVRALVRELRDAPVLDPAPREELALDPRGLARVVADNLGALVAQKMLEEGVTRAAAEQEIGGLRLVLESFEVLRAELERADDTTPELRVFVRATPADREAGR